MSTLVDAKVLNPALVIFYGSENNSSNREWSMCQHNDLNVILLCLKCKDILLMSGVFGDVLGLCWGIRIGTKHSKDFSAIATDWQIPAIVASQTVTVVLLIPVILEAFYTHTPMLRGNEQGDMQSSRLRWQPMCN